jgi:hypothetical protein
MKHNFFMFLIFLSLSAFPWATTIISTYNSDFIFLIIIVIVISPAFPTPSIPIFSMTLFRQEFYDSPTLAFKAATSLVNSSICRPWPCNKLRISCKTSRRPPAAALAEGVDDNEPAAADDEDFSSEDACSALLLRFADVVTVVGARLSGLTAAAVEEDVVEDEGVSRFSWEAEVEEGSGSRICVCRDRVGCFHSSGSSSSSALLASAPLDLSAKRSAAADMDCLLELTLGVSRGGAADRGSSAGALGRDTALAGEGAGSECCDGGGTSAAAMSEGFAFPSYTSAMEIFIGTADFPWNHSALLIAGFVLIVGG